ncbi:TPA: hypothetical protein ACS8CD_002372 [Providencia alcalifaciens]|uniref:hypothetical protein n=1 Tax=Providencia alcalifaciens TaxID=126385 RepID=UPI0032D9FB81
MKSKVIAMAAVLGFIPLVSFAAPQCGLLIDNINTTNREVKLNVIDQSTGKPVVSDWGLALATDSQFDLAKFAYEHKRPVCIEWTTVSNKKIVSTLYFDGAKDNQCNR